MKNNFWSLLRVAVLHRFYCIWGILWGNVYNKSQICLGICPWLARVSVSGFVSVCEYMRNHAACKTTLRYWLLKIIYANKLAVSLCCGPWARHIYASLVLVQPRKTCPCLTERLLMGRKESNQTNKANKLDPDQAQQTIGSDLVLTVTHLFSKWAGWLSGRVWDQRCVFVEDTLSSALYWFNLGRKEIVLKWLKNCWQGWKASTQTNYVVSN